MRQGLISRNPADLVNVPRRGDIEAQTWDAEQCRLFLGAAKHRSRFYPLYLFSLMTAARPGEVLALTWENVDLTYGEARIAKKMYRLAEKERQAVGLADKLLIDAPKTKSGIRTIPLPGVLVEELRRLKQEQDATKAVMGDQYHDHGLVFCQANG